MSSFSDIWLTKMKWWLPECYNLFKILLETFVDWQLKWFICVIKMHANGYCAQHEKKDFFPVIMRALKSRWSKCVGTLYLASWLVRKFLCIRHIVVQNCRKWQWQSKLISLQIWCRLRLSLHFTLEKARLTEIRCAVHREHAFLHHTPHEACRRTQK